MPPAEGITPEKINFSSSYPVLRNASVRACVGLYNWLSTADGRDIISKSWAKCVVPGKPEYNLSYACLSSRSSQRDLRKYLQQDTILAEEIKSRLGAINLLTSHQMLGLLATKSLTMEMY
jgi:hypothetical protein